MIAVFGSINIDFLCRVERFPRVGETMIGLSSTLHPGGKGANQALAAARAGASVCMYGAVGRDVFAVDALALLHRDGVQLGGVIRVDAATGCASILVDANGDNCIVVVAGANAVADPASVPDAVLGADSIVVMQHELPAAANAALMQRAWNRGARIVLNAAPARAIGIQALRLVDTLIVNADEARALAVSLSWPEEPREFMAQAIRSIAGLTVVVTLGPDGALAARGSAALRVSAPAVHVVDTTGAGDAFVGVMVAAYDAGLELAEAVRQAVAGGSLACTTAGAQDGLPRLDEIRAVAAGLASRPL